MHGLTVSLRSNVPHLAGEWRDSAAVGSRVWLCGAQAGLARQGSGRRAISGDGHRGEGSAGLGTQLCCAVLLVLIPSSPWSESVRGAACDSLLSASVRAGH